MLASRVLRRRAVPAVLALGVLTACGPESATQAPGAPVPAAAAPAATGTSAAATKAAPPPLPLVGRIAPAPRTTPPATTAPAPPAQPTGGIDTSKPDRVVGTGTAASCTSAAVVAAVAAGGVVAFRCGAAPVTIRMTATAKVVNRNPRLVLDGGGTVTLSGGGVRRILYQNTCDPAQGYTTDHCQDQDSPRLVLQNIGFADGNSTGERAEGGGGGAVFVRGGLLAVTNAWFTGNRCDTTGPDLGGAAIRALSLHAPAVVTGSRFSGGVCSNGGALSSIGVSWQISGSTFTGNRAIGTGANPARGGTPGGGSGGAIYLDGNLFTLRVTASTITGNTANEGGGAVFFVSNDRTGTLRITGSTLRSNVSKGFETVPGIFFLGAGKPEVS